jgi:hypothetical protein
VPEESVSKLMLDLHRGVEAERGKERTDAISALQYGASLSTAAQR